MSNEREPVDEDEDSDHIPESEIEAPWKPLLPYLPGSQFTASVHIPPEPTPSDRHYLNKNKRYNPAQFGFC